MNNTKKVLITGASGFIGRQCLAPLVKLGYEVHAVSINSLDLGDNIRQYSVNLLDYDEQRQILEAIKPNIILHVAWYAEHGKYWNAPENSEWLKASTNMISLASKLGVERIVGVGSCAEYDWQCNDMNLFKETDICKPHTAYGKSKLALKETLKESGISHAWARLFLLFGQNENSARLVPSIINSLLKNEPANCSSGKQVRDFMDTRDIGTALAMLVGSEIQGVVNVASGQPMSVGDLAKTLGEIIGKPELIQLGALPDRDNEPHFIVADTTRLVNELKFTPAASLEQRLKRPLPGGKNKIANYFKTACFFKIWIRFSATVFCSSSVNSGKIGKDITSSVHFSVLGKEHGGKFECSFCLCNGTG